MRYPRRMGVYLRAFLLTGVAIASLSAQDGPLAPQVPVSRRPLDLFVRERLVSVSQGRPLRLVRYGKAGDLESPGVLDLPFEGRSVEVRSYDWLMAGDRPVELRRLPGYDGWIEVSPGSHLVVLSDELAELVYGTVTLFGDDAYGSVLRIGSITIRGDGRSTVRRDAASLAIRVESGRFEISRDGTLVASLGAGQQRELLLDGPDRADEDQASERYRAMAGTLEEALFSNWSPDALVLDGAALLPIWERTRSVLPVYARASMENAQWIEFPDIWERRIGEALRILAAYSFIPETGA